MTVWKFQRNSRLFLTRDVAKRYADRWPGDLGALEPRHDVSPFADIVWFVDDPVGDYYPEQPDLVLCIDNRSVPVHFA